MKYYTFEITITEGDHEFWEGYDCDSGTYKPELPSMDDVAQVVKDALENDGVNLESIKHISKQERFSK